ncbi:MAG: dihydropteroate synthase, partial [Candidatus Peregrinibacteria bacterium]|nr:dihydropteroate synthase [Candidatus Peregrinibacteria bacterium]
LVDRITLAEEAGIDRSQIILDPGMGAFVSGEARYSMQILVRLREFDLLDRPVLIGASRKSFIRDIWGGDLPQDRVEGSLMAATMAILNGAHMIRAHDVRETKEVIDFTCVPF